MPEGIAVSTTTEPIQQFQKRIAFYQGMGLEREAAELHARCAYPSEAAAAAEAKRRASISQAQEKQDRTQAKIDAHFAGEYRADPGLQRQFASEAIFVGYSLNRLKRLASRRPDAAAELEADLAAGPKPKPYPQPQTSPRPPRPGPRTVAPHPARRPTLTAAEQRARNAAFGMALDAINARDARRLREWDRVGCLSKTSA